ncbi:MAG: hydroxysqualene dehydroxylase HpnE [Terriglobales bacterium]
MTAQESPSVAIVGGGLAGLAAGCALAGAGYSVSLLERRPYLGGRASSYQHPGTGEVVDNCQHVLLGCCTNLIDLYRRVGAEDKIRWYRQLTFIEPGGRRSVIEPGLLPAPFHSATSFLGASCLSLSDKWAIARAMLALAGRLPDDNSAPFLTWLRAHGQTQRAIDRFWRVVLVSALNEDLDRVSSHYAAQVFRESFLKSADAGALGLPALPLSDLYAIAGDYIQRQGGSLQLRATADAFRPEPATVRICSAGRDRTFDYAVLAVPFNVLASMLPPDDAAAAPLRSMLDRFQTSPITGIHLWFDRQITDLPHAVLLDRTIQWMFHKSSFQETEKSGGSYVELVVSSSKTLVDKPRQEILDLALRELSEFFPEARSSKVLKSTVIKEVNATYAPLPGADAHRPPQASPWLRVFLAGDWTATGWPATMEGAVRSGYLAAEALTRAAGTPRKFLVPDLPARGLMRFFKQH